LDLYEPTKKTLEWILPYLTKGSIIVFDDLNFHSFPGETIAVREILKINKIKLQKLKFDTVVSYMVYE